MVKTKILLVEDDKSLREIYGVRLYSEGYDIISAGDGEEALALAIKERPPLIISDVMMPKISGFDMLDILRSTTETKDIKVIMMTALSSEDQRARGESLGADRYLVKSQVGIEDVVRAVHEVLGDAPVAGVAATPQTQPAAAPPVEPDTEPTPLPQPTAPFSTDRPASLGDRVIHPLESNGSSKDFGALMSAELNGGMGTPSDSPTAPVPSEPTGAPEPVNFAPKPAPISPEDDFDIPPIPATSLESDQDNSTAMPVPSTPPPLQPVAAEPATMTMLSDQPDMPSGLSFEETPKPSMAAPLATEAPVPQSDTIVPEMPPLPPAVDEPTQTTPPPVVAIPEPQSASPAMPPVYAPNPEPVTMSAGTQQATPAPTSPEPITLAPAPEQIMPAGFTPTAPVSAATVATTPTDTPAPVAPSSTPPLPPLSVPPRPGV